MTNAAVYDGYIRVSRVNGRTGDSFISPGVQRERIEAWAVMRGARIGQWHTDLDVSGAARERPGLEAAVGRVQSGRAAGIVVAKVDRLARSLPVAFDVIERLDRVGGQLIAVEEGIDPTTATGKLLRGLLLLMASWYREQVRDSWATARERAVARGAYVSSTVPVGYRKRDDARLEPDVAWAAVVLEGFRRRAGGAAWVEIADVFNAAGLPVRYAGDGDGGARWTGHTVAQVLRNRVYLGESRHGDYVNAAAHEAIVSPALFDAATVARSVPAPRTARDPALLAGVLRCAGCGYSMYQGRGRGAGGATILSYRCRGGGAGGRCPERAFAYTGALDELVERWLLHHADGLAVEAVEEVGGELERVLGELEAAEHALRVFRDDPRVIGVLGADGFAEGLAGRARRVEEARAELAAARRTHSAMPDPFTLRGLWPGLDVHGRRRILAAAVDVVVVAGRGPLTADRVRVCAAGTGPRGALPRQGVRGVGLRPLPLDGLPEESRVELGG